MTDRKFDVINSSPLCYTLPEMSMKMETGPDGRTVPAFVFERARRAVEIRDDLSVEFNVYAPGAKTVEVTGTEGTRWGEEKHPLQPVGDGWWRTVIPDIPAGVQFLYYFIDGVNTLYKYAPVCYAHSIVCNFVEVPAKDFDFYDFKDVPHGAVRCEYYDSGYTGALRNCWVYTPPSYDSAPDKRYPVLYMYHGGGENETGWFWQGKINFILDNLIAEGKCPEMIVVSNYLQAPQKGVQEMELLPGNVNEPVIADCIPFIDRRFRTIPDKAHRALCGLSMGAYLTVEMSFRHPEYFDWLGVFSGARGGELVKDMTPEEIAAYNASHQLLYFSQGMQEGGDKLPEKMRQLRDAGVSVEYFLSEGVHEWQTWRKAAHDFVQRIFR